MEQEERWAMIDASKEEVEDRLGYALTADEWDTVVAHIYEDAKDDFLDSIEQLVSEMECVNALA
jgi:hypothetical protein